MGKDLEIYWRHKGDKCWIRGILAECNLPEGLVKIKYATWSELVILETDIDYMVCPEEADFPEED